MPPKLLTLAEERQLIAAIGQAEKNNLGEVRVHIEQKCPEKDPLLRAETIFYQQGMQHTKNSTGVLLYIATKSRTAAVFADKGIYQAAEEGIWQTIIDNLGRSFSAQEPLKGMVDALHAIGDILHRLVPGEDADNELVDGVSYDQKEH